VIYLIIVSMLALGIVYRKSGKTFSVIDGVTVSLAAVFCTLGLSYLTYFAENSFAVESVYCRFALVVIFISVVFSVIMSLRLFFGNSIASFFMLIGGWFLMSILLVNSERIVSTFIGHELDVKTVTFRGDFNGSPLEEELWVAGENYGKLPVKIELNKLMEISRQSNDKVFQNYSLASLPVNVFEFNRTELSWGALRSGVPLSNLKIPMMVKLGELTLPIDSSRWDYRTKDSKFRKPIPLDVQAAHVNVEVNLARHTFPRSAMEKLVKWARLNSYEINDSWIKAASQLGYICYGKLAKFYLREGEFEKLLLPVIHYKEKIPKVVDKATALKIYENMMREVNETGTMVPFRDYNILRIIYDKLDKDALLEKAISDIDSGRFDVEIMRFLKEEEAWSDSSSTYNDSFITVIALKHWHELLVKTGQSDYIGRTIFANFLRKGEKFSYYRNLFPDISAEYILAKFRTKGESWADDIDYVTPEFRAVLEYRSPDTDRFVNENSLQIIQIISKATKVDDPIGEWRTLAQYRPGFFKKNWRFAFERLQDGKAAIRRLYNLPQDLYTFEMVNYVFSQFAHEGLLYELRNMRHAAMAEKLCMSLKSEIEKELSKDDRYRGFYESVKNGKNLIFEKISKLSQEATISAFNELRSYSTSEDENIRKSTQRALTELHQIKELDLNSWDLIEEVYRRK